MARARLQILSEVLRDPPRRTLRRVQRRAQGMRPQRPWPYTTYGRGSYGGTVVWHEGDPPHRVTVGNYCAIAGGVEFMIGGGHRTDWVSMFPFRIIFDLPGATQDGHPSSRGDIVVGSDVWIGRDALVLSGVTIGHGAVVASRSVVTRDVEPYAIVAGAPAHLVRRRFSGEDIAALLALAWWDWPESELLAIVDLLNAPDVAALIDYGRSRRADATRAACAQP